MNWICDATSMFCKDLNLYLFRFKPDMGGVTKIEFLFFMLIVIPPLPGSQNILMARSVQTIKSGLATSSGQDLMVNLELDYLGEQEFTRNYILTIRNNENVEIAYGLSYRFEMLIFDHWIRVSTPHPVIAIAYIVDPGESRQEAVNSQSLLPGRYRLVLPVRRELGGEQEIFTEFDVGFDPVAFILPVAFLGVAATASYYAYKWIRAPRKKTFKPVYSPDVRRE